MFSLYPAQNLYQEWLSDNCQLHATIKSIDLILPATRERSRLVESLSHCDELFARGQIFRRHGHHTVTGLLDLNGTPIFAKRVDFRQKRFVNRFRYNVMPSRGHWSAFMAWILERAGFHTPKVLGSGEVRRQGLIAETYLFTEAITPTPGDRFLEAACEEGRPLVDSADRFLKSLRHLHDAGITHGDLKMNNLYILPNGAVGYWDLDSALFWPLGVPSLLRHRHTSYLIANLMTDADTRLPAGSVNARDFIAACAESYGDACSLRHLQGFLQNHWLKGVRLTGFC